MTEQTTLISEWLTSPHRLEAEDQQKVSDLLARFPYLVPARIMQAAKGFDKSGFSEEMLHEAKLFSGNWHHFYQTMIASKSEKKANFSSEQNLNSSKKETEESLLDEEEMLIMDEIVPVGKSGNKNNLQHGQLAQPLFVDNYFQHQGINVPDAIPAELDKVADKEQDEKSLMVMMGFDEWLLFLKRKNDAKKSDEEDKAIVRSIWQREKLAAAMGEEDDNIPEAVFEMAINSIDREDIMVSEPLAEIHAKQGRFDKAIEIYRKLSLQNPEKKTYFAAKINQLNKENRS